MSRPEGDDGVIDEVGGEKLSRVTVTGGAALLTLPCKPKPSPRSAASLSGVRGENLEADRTSESRECVLHDSLSFVL